MEFEVNFSVNVIGYGFVRLTEVADCCSRGRVCKIFFLNGPILKYSLFYIQYNTVVILSGK